MLLSPVSQEGNVPNTVHWEVNLKCLRISCYHGNHVIAGIKQLGHGFHGNRIYNDGEVVFIPPDSLTDLPRHSGLYKGLQLHMCTRWCIPNTFRAQD